MLRLLSFSKYDGKGYKKRAIKLGQHGLIFSSERPPRKLKALTKSHFGSDFGRDEENSLTTLYYLIVHIFGSSHSFLYTVFADAIISLL